MPEIKEQAPLDADSVLNYLRKLAREELQMPKEKVETISMSTNLVGGLQLDSLAQAVLIAEVEEKYGFWFELEERTQLQQAETVGDFVEIILTAVQRSS
ncbi:MAG TPA: acyl carrier protein [Acidobacteriota bacterium]|nr:acyl carrier protein [Acidobacteriota bacterium]